jgi:hypothetical protein
MATAKRRKVPGSNPFPNVPPNLISSFEVASELKKRRDKKRSGNLYEMMFGGKGAGKSFISTLLADHMKKELEKKIEESGTYEPEVAVITDEEMKDLNEPTRKYFTNKDVFTASGGGGGGSGAIPNSVKQHAYQYQQQSNPWQQQQQQNQRSWGYPTSEVPPWLNDDTPEKATARKKKVQEDAKKQEYTAEEFKGRFCAVVTITCKRVDTPYTGVIFVKKCGHWKLMDFNGNKLVGGKAGSFEEQLRSGQIKIEIHKTLYDAEPPKLDNMDLEIV